MGAVFGLIIGISSKKIGGMFLEVPTDSIFYGGANFIGNALVTIGTTTVVVIVAVGGIFLIIKLMEEGSRY